MSDTHNHGERPDFAERVAALVGKGGYRTPSEGRGTKADKMPDEHAVAAVMAFARQDADDIGPDIAYDLATGMFRHRVVVVRAVSAAMATDRSHRAIRRNRQWLSLACHVAYGEVMGLHAVSGPSEMSEDDWAMLVESAKRIMLRVAEDALRRAERAYMGRERRVLTA